MRTYYQNHNLTSYEIVLNEADNMNHSSQPLSTQFCIYVHSALIATLFIVAIIRYFYEKKKSFKN